MWWCDVHRSTTPYNDCNYTCLQKSTATHNINTAFVASCELLPRANARERCTGKVRRNFYLTNVSVNERPHNIYVVERARFTQHSQRNQQPDGNRHIVYFLCMHQCLESCEHYVCFNQPHAANELPQWNFAQQTPHGITLCVTQHTNCTDWRRRRRRGGWTGVIYALLICLAKWLHSFFYGDKQCCTWQTGCFSFLETTAAADLYATLCCGCLILFPINFASHLVINGNPEHAIW